MGINLYEVMYVYTDYGPNEEPEAYFATIEARNMGEAMEET